MSPRWKRTLDVERWRGKWNADREAGPTEKSTSKRRKRDERLTPAGVMTPFQWSSADGGGQGRSGEPGMYSGLQVSLSSALIGRHPFICQRPGLSRGARSLPCSRLPVLSRRCLSRRAVGTDSTDSGSSTPDALSFF